MKHMTAAGLLVVAAFLVTQAFGLQTTAWRAAPPKVHPGCQALGERKLQPADLAQGDIYGAALAVDGEVALVASEWDDDQGKDSGAVFVYRCNQRTWSQAQKLLPDDGQAGDNFGRSVELDGDVAVVGTHWDSDQGFQSGAVYVFRYSGTAFAQEQKLLAYDGQKGDSLGNSVSVDGDVLVAGAWREDQKGFDAGAAYVWRYNGQKWLPVQKLVASDGGPNDGFGRHVNVNGNVIAVGAWLEDELSPNSGAVYMFRHNGTSWVEEKKLKASDAALENRLGWAVYQDGNAVVAGALADNVLGSQSGSAYIWRYNGTDWVEEQKIVPSDGQPFDHFGFSIAIDGDNLAVGAPVKLNEVLGPGAVYLYKFDGSTWKETLKVVPSDGAPQDAFGFHLAFRGRVLATGSWRKQDAGADSGAAYIYTFQDL